MKKLCLFTEEASRPYTKNGHLAVWVKGISPSLDFLDMGRRSVPHVPTYIYIFTLLIFYFLIFFFNFFFIFFHLIFFSLNLYFISLTIKYYLHVILYFLVIKLILIIYPIKFILKMTNNIWDITKIYNIRRLTHRQTYILLVL